MCHVQLAVARLQRRAVVVERPAPVAEDGPPSGGLDELPRAERGDEQPERGQRPQHRDDEGGKRGPARREAPLGPRADTALCAALPTAQLLLGLLVHGQFDRHDCTHQRTSCCFLNCTPWSITRVRKRVVEGTSVSVGVATGVSGYIN